MCTELVPQEGISLEGGKEEAMADAGEQQWQRAELQKLTQLNSLRRQGRKTIYRISNSQGAETACKGAGSKEQHSRSLSSL